MPASDLPCRLCASLGGTAPVPVDEPIIATQFGVGLASLGAMVEGWTIVLPREHVLSARQLDDSSVETLTALVDETRRLVSQVYGDSVLFEHGAVRPNSAVGCGVDHAHIHVVPLASAGLLDDVKAACPLLHWTSAPSISDLAQLVPIGTPYLWLSTAEGADVGFGAEIGSQVVRRVIARRLGITHQYDWRAFPHEPTALATIRNLRRPRASELVATAA